MSEHNEVQGPEAEGGSDFRSLPAPVSAGDLGLVLDAATLAKVRKVVADGTPANTRRAYAADLRFFEGWRAASGFPGAWPVAPEVMVRFLVEQVEGMAEGVEQRLLAEGLKRTRGVQAWSTVERRIAAVATAHRTRGLPSPLAHPAVVEMVGRARRASVARGWSPKRKAAADREILEKLLATCEDTLTGIRDRAILLFGFSTGGRRRSEISEATLDRLQRVGQQYVYRMGKTKTEQEGGDRPVPLTGRTAKAMARWLAESGVQDGPLFRAVWDNGQVMSTAIAPLTVARMIKRRAALAGLDPEEFGGHSLRAGFMTEAGARRISMVEAMSLSGHSDVNTAAIYYRAGEVLSVEAGRMMEGERAAPGAGADDDLGVILEAAAGLAAADRSPPSVGGEDGEDVAAGRRGEPVHHGGDGAAASAGDVDVVIRSPDRPDRDGAERVEAASESGACPELAAFRPSFLSD